MSSAHFMVPSRLAYVPAQHSFWLVLGAAVISTPHLTRMWLFLRSQLLISSRARDLLDVRREEYLPSKAFQGYDIVLSLFVAISGTRKNLLRAVLMIPSIFFLLTMATFQVIYCWLTIQTRGRGRKLSRKETLQNIGQDKGKASSGVVNSFQKSMKAR